MTIFAHQAKPGTRYLSPKGVPVRVVAVSLEAVRLVVEPIKTEISVAPLLLLRPFDENGVSDDARFFSQFYGREEIPAPAPVQGGPRSSPAEVAAFVDPLLMAGGRTVREIAAALASSGLRLADSYVPRYVHGRVGSLRKRGFVIEKDEQGRVLARKP